jgi:hypothetical protein
MQRDSDVSKPQQNDEPLQTAVAYICRNSLATEVRAGLIKQLVRSHVSGYYVDLPRTQDLRQIIETRVSYLCRTFVMRGWL